MSQVLYRKYRPQSFDEIVGQQHIVTTLRNAIKTGDISHAYLFSGPRGTGKTTMARVFTKTLNCNSSAQKDDVCLKCDICNQLEKGSFVDLIEIDAASNRGIDDIRELKEAVRVSPAVGDYKVYLVDEAHMLTKEASNALLKMLEEPPAHAIFILATTEPHKLLPTIMSRTQHFDFHFLNSDEIKNKLQGILTREKRILESAVLDLVTLASGGSLRDAESILGKILSLNTPTEQVVRGILGLVDIIKISNFIDFLIENKKDDALNYINEITQTGTDLEQFIINTIEYMRKILFLKMSPSSEKLIAKNFTKEELQVAKKQTDLLTEKKIYGIIKQLLNASQDIKYSPVPQLPLELAVVEIIGEE
ncbi:MAG: DNA polymerase III, subunit gamma and tau [Candidatus Spechtbacteria bacterium RIFCSPLOWO2_02_FULL_38_8]|uniref:DNA polymerase III subunit gamma/tau n=1 Tax=Candidatus Spechtbacteria bacterium RIFCSPLOWO2_02_FULL_38_8 TaxID=1802164 RepID=A0A1G2HJM9_9BACT|nr:MAG: DNA polymerase III, subunit gamma and tau [Candidatus Spechtbacteria bacterium RIFCSPLOWO2_02_FULL_38_8]